MTESGNSTSQPKKRKWLILLRPKVAIPLVLLVLVLLSPVLIRGWNLSKIPDLGDPYVEREVPELEEADNAWVNYQRARELWVQPSPSLHANLMSPFFVRRYQSEHEHKSYFWTAIWKEPPAGTEVDSDDHAAGELRLIKHHYEQNLPMLEEWKAGTAKSRYYEPAHAQQSHRSIRRDQYETEDFSLMPRGGVLVTLKAGQLVSQGKRPEALDWMLAVYRYSRHLTQSGGTANWERAILVSQGLFRDLDELLDDEAFTHEDLIDFLHKLEESYELTGTLERAQLEDYFTLKQRLRDAYEKGEKYREELALSRDHPGLWMVPESKSNFELFLEGEPQLSIRVMQHHFESLKRNLSKPVSARATDAGGPWGTDPDGITLSADEWEAYRSQAGILELAVSQRDLFTNPFLAEDDAAVFESLRILIAAHAFARQSSDQLPAVTMDDLVEDSLQQAPRDPYNPSLPLILAADRDGRLFVLTSASKKYEHLANGGTLETLPEDLGYSTLSLIINGHHPPDKPLVEELMFRLPVQE